MATNLEMPLAPVPMGTKLKTFFRSTVKYNKLRTLFASTPAQDSKSPPPASAAPASSTAPAAKDTKLETPFTTAAKDTDTAFWQAYIAARPQPSEAFFQRIDAYHAHHSDGGHALAHDVGTGPGNIALRLAPQYARVVGSDVNPNALAAATALCPPADRGRVTFVQSGAEKLAGCAALPADARACAADLVVVSECMPLLDAPVALSSFHALLRPRGTLAVYFYGRPLFADGPHAAACNALYERAADRVTQFLWPFSGTPGFPFQQRGVEALCSSLDNIALDAQQWTAVQRVKVNCDGDHALLFNGPKGFDFEIQRVDRRGEHDETVELADQGYWADDWDVERVRAYLDSVYPNHRQRAGAQYAELDAILDELREAMGGVPRTVYFPVVLILATKREDAP